jgi:ligand-binding sensor domain-containing protein
VVGVFASELAWEDIGRGNLNLKTVLVEPDKPRIIYIGSSNGVFKTEDGGETWRNILSLRGQNKAVNFLSFNPQDKNSLFAATGNGLFYSSNQGKNWKRIFKGKNYLESECTTLAALPYGIYLGTKAGLFVSIDKGRSWHKETGNLGNSHILAIASDLKEPDYIYVACVGGVYKTQDKGKSWENIFVANPTENNNNHEDEEEQEDQDEGSKISSIRYITLDHNNLNYIYLATSRGIYKSQDKGQSWELISGYGLLNRDVRFLLVSPKSNLYALTKSGIFGYRDERWQELSLGLVTDEVRFLALDNQQNLYAACDKGLFKAKIENFSNDEQEGTLISLYCKNEPTIDEVQQAAIRYAEVEPEKIKLWREQAAKKAWLPQLGVGLDRNVTDLWHWEGGSTTKTDDDTLRRGHDSVEWDVTLSWDLGELIWNEDQTSIDVRSKLMVQLRDDVLDEVTKLYFERIRVKMELDNLSIEDRKKLFEKELRLQELTAYLDALTGGYFSNHIKGAETGS